MKKVLIGIPCLFGAWHTKEAIESVVNHPDVSVLLIDNGAEESVKNVIASYERLPNVFVTHNHKNIYVNPAWNQIMDFFLTGNRWDICVLMNSDLVMHLSWKQVLDDHYEYYPSLVPVPEASSDLAVLSAPSGPTMVKHNPKVVPGGIAGVFICMTKEQVQKVYPIPSELQVWFGDNWIYDIIRSTGNETAVVNSLICYHSGSQNVTRVVGIGSIIEQDKQHWAGIIATMMRERIDKLNIGT